jgi:methylated-DNA-[protein]-cysteine S-methyltransferase
MKKQQQGTPFSAIVGAPFGAVGMRIDGAALVELVFLAPHVGLMPACDPVSRLAAGQLVRYFADPDFRFDLPLAGAGSLFQRKVWAAIAAIPRGQVRTYGALARDIGSAARAVGQACGANPFPLLVPCHRITAASGLGGFAHHADGFHVGVKRWLLAHEAAALA